MNMGRTISYIVATFDKPTFDRLTQDGTIQARSIRDEIVLQVQRDIISGVFLPGQRMVERELIGRFGVSSIPVREALQDLESRGLLTRRLNYGYSVVELSSMDVLRICELRRLVEPKVAEWAAERITAAEIRGLEVQLREMERGARSADMGAFFHADLGFHRLLWKASGNEFAAKALEMTVGSLFASGLARSLQATAAMKAAPIDRVAEVAKHRRILVAIRAGRGAEAAGELLEMAEGFERHFRVS